MFRDFRYVPTLAIKPSEVEGVRRLPDFDKDALLPSILLRKWYNSRSLDNSFAALEGAMDGRPAILDLGLRPVEIKTACDERLIQLHTPIGGHRAWTDLIAEHERLIPTVQWGGTGADTVAQVERLCAMGRAGIVLRLRRAQQWDLASLAALGGFDFACPILVVLEYGQLAPRSDLTVAAAEIAGIARTVLGTLLGASVTFTLSITSFPPEFASINREHARLPIQERGLFSILAASAPFSDGEVTLIYGDRGSVCVDRGEIARGGAPRIDLSCRNEWAYYRREVDRSYVAAADAVMLDEGWQPELFIWGTNEIRRAASGDLSGLEYQRNWVAVRINVHLHQQLHYDTPGGALDTDEPWVDD